MIVVAIVALDSNTLAAPTAETLFNDGQTAYDHGNYRLAIDRWQEAYRLSNEPALLFNVAQAYRLADDCGQALSSYKQFVAIDPTSEQRPLADEFVRELEPKCGTSRHAAIVDAPSTPSRSGDRLKIAGVLIGGAGALSTVGGLALGHHGQTLGDEVTLACSVSCDWAEQKGKDAAGRRDATSGYALDGVGVAAIVGGAILYYFGDRQGRVTVSRPREGGAVVSWSRLW